MKMTKEGKVTINRSNGRQVKVLVSGDFFPTVSAARKLGTEPAKILGPVADLIKRADVSVINLESPLTTCRKKIIKCGPNMKLPPCMANGLKKAGFSVASLANNHIRDFGVDGVRQTVEELDNAKIKWFGIGETQKNALNPCVIRKNGLKIAMIGVAEHEFSIVDDDGWGAAGLDESATVLQIQKTAESNDVVLVFVHGGNEFCPVPSPRMVKLYRSFVVAGATAVIGSHPHVPQGYEVYNGVPIFYSLGNLLFACPTIHPLAKNMWNYGFSVLLTLSSKKVVDFRIIPTAIDQKTSSLYAPDKPLQQKFNAYLKHLCDLATDPKKQRSLWDAWCAMQGAPRMNYLRNAPPNLPEDQAQYGKLAAAENMLHCEAHNELITHYMYLVRSRRIDQAVKQIPKLQKIMNVFFQDNN